MTVTTASNVIDPGMELHDLLLDREFLDREDASNRAQKRFEALQTLAHGLAGTHSGPWRIARGCLDGTRRLD
jgi:hypothetical protein